MLRRRLSTLSADLAYALQPSLWAAEALGFEADGKQKQILDSPHKRVIINCHRQWGKSTISSIICLHRAIFYPGSLCLIVAPALRQSSENFRKVLIFLDALDHSPSLIEDTKLSCQLDNKSRILSLPGGNEGSTIRGFSRPDVIVEDESSRCKDELYQALRPMMATNPACRLILASTPCGQRGHFHRIWVNGSSEWQKIAVRASENPRIDPAFLAEERRSMPDSWYRQEYEGEFIESNDSVFTFEQITSAIDDDVEPLLFSEED